MLSRGLWKLMHSRWRSFQTRRWSMESRFFNWKLQLVQQLGLGKKVCGMHTSLENLGRKFGMPSMKLAEQR
ncbi:hypothetical protein V6Z11_D04G063700 [Gossypium hirsutum]